MILITALGLPPGHSAAFNFAWSTQYSDALTWTNPLPRYLPGLWSGLGGHDFFFYAPLPFWFVAVFVDPLCPGCAPSTEFVIGCSLVLVASGFSMFAFLRCFFPARPASFGAVVYVVLPYHLLIDWFERQAAGEFTAYAFLPLIALGIERIRRNENGGWILTVGVAATALSHLPTTLLAAHPFAALVVAFAAIHPGGAAAKLRLFARFVWFAGLGLALASFYWLPAIMLLDTVSSAVLFDIYFEAWRWLYGGTEPQPNAQFASSVLVSFLACVPLLLCSMRSARGPILAWILVPATFAIVLNVAPSEPIWRAWIIAKVQFPWRFMALVDFATAIAAAALAAAAVDRVGKRLLSLSVVAALVPVSMLALSVQYRTSGVPEQRYDIGFGAIEYLSPEMLDTLQRRLGQPRLDAFDQYDVLAEMQAIAAEFQAINGTPDIRSRGARSFTVLPMHGSTVLSLPDQYWIFWQAQTASGEALEVRANPQFGTIDIIAPAAGFEAEPVIVSLPFHPSEWAGGAVSVLALIALLASLKATPAGVSSVAARRETAEH